LCQREKQHGGRFLGAGKITSVAFFLVRRIREAAL
jgi:hypothetical protein